MADIDVVHTVKQKSQDVELTCGKFTIHPLSVAECIKLLADMKDVQGQVKGSLGQGKDHEVVVEALMLAGDRWPGLVARLMGLSNPMPETLDELGRMNIEDMSVMAMTITEVNNFGRIYRNFQKAMENGPWEPK